MKKLGAHRGFTLIELLVVVSIIALLVSILLPALGKARNQAKRAVCATQLKQVGIAWLNYSYEHKDWFPYNWWLHSSGGIWTQALGNWTLLSYTIRNHFEEGDYGIEGGEIFYCPNFKPHDYYLPDDATEAKDHWNYYRAAYDAGSSSPDPEGLECYFVGYAVYSCNTNADAYSVSLGNNLPSPKKSTDPGIAGLPVMFDETNCWYTGASEDYGNSVHYEGGGTRGVPAGGNALMGDGRVEWRNFDDMIIVLDSPSYGFRRYF